MTESPERHSMYGNIAAQGLGVEGVYRRAHDLNDHNFRGWTLVAIVQEGSYEQVGSSWDQQAGMTVDRYGSVLRTFYIMRQPTEAAISDAHKAQEEAEFATREARADVMRLEDKLKERTKELKLAKKMIDDLQHDGKVNAKGYQETIENVRQLKASLRKCKDKFDRVQQEIGAERVREILGK